MATVLTASLKLDLSDFQNSIKTAATKGRDLATAISDSVSKIKVSIDGNSVKPGLRNIEDEIGKTGTKIQGVFQKAFNFEMISNAVSKISGSLATLQEPLIAIDKNARQIGTLGVDNWKALEDQFKSLQKTTGADAAAGLDALYDAVSAGTVRVVNGQADLKGAFDFIQSASKLAKAGASDVKATTDALTNVMNSYGVGADKAMSVSDSIMGAVKFGKTTVGEMAANVANVAPVAAQVGLSIDEMNAAIAGITKVGIKTGPATTMLRQSLVELQKPTANLQIVMQKAGVSINTLKVDGAAKTFIKLKKTMEEMGITANQAFSSVEAAGAMNALTTQMDGDYIINNAMAAMKESKGLVNQSAALMNDAIGNTAARAFNKLQGFVNDFLGSLGPGFNALVASVQKLLPLVMGLVGLKMLFPTNLFKDALTGFSSLRAGASTALTEIKTAYSSVSKSLLTSLNPANVKNQLASLSSSIQMAFNPKSIASFVSGIGTGFKSVITNSKGVVVAMLTGVVPATTTAGTAGATSGWSVATAWAAALAPILAVVAGITAGMAVIWGAIKLVQGYSKSLEGESTADADKRIALERKVLSEKQKVIDSDLAARKKSIDAIDNYSKQVTGRKTESGVTAQIIAEDEALKKMSMNKEFLDQARTKGAAAYEKQERSLQASLLELSGMYPGVISSSKSYEENLKALNKVRDEERLALNKSKIAYIEMQDLQLKLDNQQQINNVRKSSEKLTGIIKEEFGGIGDKASEWLFGTSGAKDDAIKMLSTYKNAITGATTQLQLDKALNTAQLDVFNSDKFKGLSDKAKSEVIKGFAALSDERKKQIDKAKQLAEKNGGDYTAYLPTIPQEAVNQKQKQFSTIIRTILAVITLGISEIFFNWNKITGAISSGFDSVMNFFKNNFQPVIKAVDYTGAVIKGLGIAIAKGIGDAARAIGDFIGKITSVVGNSIWKIFTETLKSISEWFSKVGQSISEIARAISDFLISAFNDLYNLLAKAYDYAEPFIGGFINPIIDGVNYLVDVMRGAWDTVTGFISDISKGFGKAVDWLAKLGGFGAKESKKNSDSVAKMSDDIKRYDDQQKKSSDEKTLATVKESKALKGLDSVIQGLTDKTITFGQARKQASLNGTWGKALLLEQTALAGNAKALSELNKLYDKKSLLISKMIKDGKKGNQSEKQDIFGLYEIQVKSNAEIMKGKDQMRERIQVERGYAYSMSEQLVLQREKIALQTKDLNSLVELAAQYGIIADSKKEAFDATASTLDAKTIEKFNEKLQSVNNTIFGMVSTEKDLTFKARLEPLDVKQAALKLADDISKSNFATVEIDYELKNVNKIELEASRYDMLVDSYKNALEQQQILKDKADLARTEAEKKDLQQQAKTKYNEARNLELEIQKQQITINDETQRYIIDSTYKGLEQQKQIELLELSKQKREELSQAQSGVASRLAIEASYNEKRIALLEKYARASRTFAENSVIDFGKTLADSFSKIKFDFAPDSKSTEKIKKIEDSYKSLKEEYKDGKVTYAEMQKKMGELDDERTKALRETTDIQTKILKSFQNAMSETFRAMKTLADNNAQDALKSRDSYLKAQAELSIKLSEINNKNSQEYTDTLTARNEAEDKAQTATNMIYSNMALSIGASLGEAVASNKSLLKSLVLASLQAIRAMVPIWSIEIAGKNLTTLESVMSGNAIGIARWAASMVILNGLLSAAEAGANNLKFEKGGLNTHGGFGGGLLTKQTTITASEGNRPEFIMSANPTKQYLPVLNAMNKGTHPLEFYKGNIHVNVDMSGVQKELASQSMQLAKIDSTLQNTKLVESRHAYNIQATNNVIQAVKTQNPFRG